MITVFIAAGIVVLFELVIISILVSGKRTGDTAEKTRRVIDRSEKQGEDK